MKNLAMKFALILSFASLTSAATFVVNITADDPDFNVGDGVCDVNSSTANSQCTLRAAIQESNATTILDNINFFIPQAGLRTIQLSNGSLPVITNPIVIDGYTQPGASPNSLSVGNDAVFRINLYGSGFGGSMITISSGNSTIRGLLITSSYLRPIVLRTNGNNSIEGCWFGLNQDGTVSPQNPNTTNITIESGNGNIIGGNTPQARNVISNSTGISNGSLYFPGYGIYINAGNHIIQNNYIGTAPNGTQSRPNSDGGVFSAGTNVVIGGTDSSTRNIISGNGRFGIYLSGINNTIQNNYIGVTANGANSLANNGDAVLLLGNGNTIQGNNIGGATNATSASSSVGIFVQSSNNLIGGTNGSMTDNCTGDCNRIAFYNKGIVLDSGNTGFLLTNNKILGNSIYSNTLLGIDLDNDGVTANDVGDGDIGANNAQNFPIVTSARSASSVTRVVGTFNGTANRTFRLEFFNTPTNDSSSYGEGQFFVGTANVTTDGSGNASYDQTFPYAAPTASYVSATTTDLTTGDTSEFAQSTQVQFDPTAANVQVAGRVLDTVGRGVFKAVVTLTKPTGETKRAVTNPFGYYRFDDVDAGETYVFSVVHKNYTFPPQIHSINEERTDLTFAADPPRR